MARVTGVEPVTLTRVDIERGKEMKKEDYSAYGETEDASAYLAEDPTYIDSCKGTIPRWAMAIIITFVIIFGVGAAIFFMNTDWSHNVDRYNKDAESTLRQEEIAEKEAIEKLNVMNSQDQPWFSGDDKGTLYFHNEKFKGEKLVIPAAFDGVYIDTLSDGFDAKNTTVKELEISEGIVTIDSGAFSGFTKLEKVSIPKTVLYVSENAFHGTPWYNNLAEKFCVVGGGVLIKYNGTENDVVIPVKVKRIDCATFKDFDDAKKILIPETVTYIGNEVFYNCSADIVGGEKISYIGNTAFMKSSFVENSKDDFVVIGMGCMVSYTIENGGVYIPDGVRQVAGIDFSAVKEDLTLYIGKDVERIADVAEIGYVSAIKVDEDNENLSSYNGILYNKAQTMLYRYPVYKTTDKFYAEQELEAVGDKAFYGCNVTQVELYNEVKVIGNMAFWECEDLEKIDLPDSLVAIGNLAFSGCKSLESVQLSNEVTVIPYSAFSGCQNLKTFVSSENLTTISAGAFYDCEKLGKFTLPDTLEKIAYNAFQNCEATLYVKNNPYFEIVDNKVKARTNEQ